MLGWLLWAKVQAPRDQGESQEFMNREPPGTGNGAKLWTERGHPLFTSEDIFKNTFPCQEGSGGIFIGPALWTGFSITCGHFKSKTRQEPSCRIRSVIRPVHHSKAGCPGAPEVLLKQPQRQRPFGVFSPAHFEHLEQGFPTFRRSPWTAKAKIGTIMNHMPPQFSPP